MGDRGPQPTPKNILKARGSNRANSKKGHENPEPQLGPTDPPAFLTDEEAEKWIQMITVLIPMKCYSEADADALAQYCQTWVTFQEMQAILKEEGHIVKRVSRDTKETIVKRHPAFDISTELRKRLKDLEASFGLTPSARARIDIKKAPAVLTRKQKNNIGPLKVVPRTG